MDWTITHSLLCAGARALVRKLSRNSFEQTMQTYRFPIGSVISWISVGRSSEHFGHTTAPGVIITVISITGLFEAAGQQIDHERDLLPMGLGDA